ncbi:PLC-like phosphodiesterase [Dipodascopsis uninucleata]
MLFSSKTVLGGLIASAIVVAAAQNSVLAEFALEKVLGDAAEVFGDYVKVTTGNAEWMKKIPDETPIVHINIPGTHDSATWNVTADKEDSLKGILELNGLVTPETDVPTQDYRCQSKSYIDMLDDGIRVFDLRYALDVSNTTLVFYHGPALASQISNLDSVLYGFYQWLDDHPSEAVFLSFQYEGDTKTYAPDDATVQLSLFNSLTTKAARKYFVQTKDKLGTIGEARGKIILLRRFDLDQLPDSYTEALPGLHFSPDLWTDNSPDITLVYNNKEQLTAFIEDYYQPLTPYGSDAAMNIQWKYNATTKHFLKAVSKQYKDSLFWSFASATNIDNVPDVTPLIMAVGNGTKYTPEGGMNQMMYKFFDGMKGKRLGIVMFDFYSKPYSSLVEKFLSLQDW